MVRSFRSQGRSAVVDGRSIDLFASTLSTIDSFEDGNFNEYTAGNGALSQWSTVGSGTVAPVDGDNSAQVDTDDTDAGDERYAQIISQNNNLNDYPQKGDEINVYINMASPIAALVGFFFFHQDSSNWYRIRLRPFSPDIQIQTRIADATGTSSSGTDAFSVDTWYRCNLTWDDGNTFGGDDGEMTLTVYEDALGNETVFGTVTRTESTFDGPDEVSWEAQYDDNPTLVFFDHAHRLVPV